MIEETRDWLRYRLPANFIRKNSSPVCIGQKQKWFLLGLEADETEINLTRSNQPEFDSWRWVHYWHPVREVIEFKRDVYRKALQELRKPLTLYMDN